MLTHSTASLTDFVCSRLFAKAGYSVALLARGADSVNALAKEITESGAEVLDFSFQFFGR
jgi:NADP-dependent 3-hydroxy acid dehydrogenase YdfG